MPHGVDVGVMFVENNEERGGGDAVCQCLTVQILAEENKNNRKSIFTTNRTRLLVSGKKDFALSCCGSNLLDVKLHPVFQLLGDVLVLPLGQVGDDDSWVEGTRVGPHAELLDGLLLEVQKTYIVILMKQDLP